MRCPSCNKFPSFDIGDPDVDIQIEDGAVTGTVRIVLTSQCCGDECKETTFDIDHDMSDDILAAFAKMGYKDVDLSDVDLGLHYDVAADERLERKTRTGKVIRNSRYMRKFYTMELTLHVKATLKGDDGKEVSVSVDSTYTDECQASGMDETA